MSVKIGGLLVGVIGAKHCSDTSSTLHSYINKYRTIRLLGLFSLVSLLLLTICTINPIYLVPEKSEATTKDATPSTLTFSSTKNTVTASLDVTSTSGSFASSSTAEKASFTLMTNNATGYTLNLKTSGSTTTLVDSSNTNSSTNSLASIDSTVLQNNFSADSGTSYNNKWGLMPSKYNGSSNTSNSIQHLVLVLLWILHQSLIVQLIAIV